jgi:nucleoside phosphorylase
MSTSAHQQFDICILCALPEEAERLKEAFSHASKEFYKDQPPVVFERLYNDDLKRDYDYATITNMLGEKLSVIVTWLVSTGPVETILQLQSLLKECKPRFAAMTGICAGDREKVKLGDIIVAERAFFYDTGKIISGKRGTSELQRDTQMRYLPTEIGHFVRGFHNWQQIVAKKQEPRPLSRRQQRDWLLNKLLDPETVHVEDISQRNLKKDAPDWEKIVYELQMDSQKGKNDAYLTPEKSLKDPARVRALKTGKDVFPFKDAEQPTVYVAPIASGSAVRADNPFADIRVPVRDTRALDMEGAAFYRVLQEFDSIHYLLVKGVCDYADKEKDDSYHDYAGKISARYLYAFLKEYVTSRRFPDIAKGQKPPMPINNDHTTAQASPEELKKGLNLFYSYAPKDIEMLESLETHLVSLTLKRGGPIRQLYANDIGIDLSKDAAKVLEQAQIILLLISPSFIFDDNLYEKQLKPAFEMQKMGKARIIPILLRPTNLKGTPLEHVIVLPRNNKAVSEWSSKDAAFYDITKEIGQVVQQFKDSMP